MSEIQFIEGVVQHAVRRRQWQSAWRGAWQGFLAGSITWFLALVLYKLLPIPIEALWWTGLAAAVMMLAGFVAGWCRRITVMETARWIDGKQQLQERLSTALEMSKTQQGNRWRDLLVADAVKCVEKVDPRQLLPYHLPKASRWALLVLALAAGLGFVPEYRTKAYVQQKRDAEIIKDTGRQLAELTRRNLEQRPPALETTRKALDTVAELGDHLAKAQLTRNDALKDLANVAEKIKEQAKELGRNPAFKTMEKANRSSNKGGSPGNADIQKQIESLQKALGNQPADSKAMEQLKQDLQKAKEAAAGLANNNSETADKARDSLSKSLSDMAKQAQDMGLSLPSLDEAISALAASQTDQVLKDLDLAETDLEKMQEMAKALEQLQLKAEKLGKDLAEQLERGQADAAQATLKKMAKALENGTLSQEQMEKMLKEVSSAIKPAEFYGKASEFMKGASKSMQSSQKKDAAENLLAAAKELDKMMQEMQEAQALMASMEALQRAQMCIGNCQGWGNCMKPGGGSLRAGKGGGLGKGVGTWADDSRWLDIGEIKERWDNSGIVRPDEDPRGISDRGDAQLADNLAPTKVKGQIAPGGPMPSITLKGVSIKGTSKVDFKEMATAAQSEAQSALSQERVPRAYQNAVRDYFDDLKK